MREKQPESDEQKRSDADTRWRTKFIYTQCCDVNAYTRSINLWMGGGQPAKLLATYPVCSKCHKICGQAKVLDNRLTGDLFCELADAGNDWVMLNSAGALVPFVGKIKHNPIKVPQKNHDSGLKKVVVHDVINREQIDFDDATFISVESE